jgi:hypothetical protein
MTPLLIEPITFGVLDEFAANAIVWTVGTIERGANEAVVDCGLINLTENGSTQVHTFSLPIPNEVLQAWGEDDSVIDSLVLSYSPKFKVR